MSRKTNAHIITLIIMLGGFGGSLLLAFLMFWLSSNYGPKAAGFLFFGILAVIIYCIVYSAIKRDL